MYTVKIPNVNHMISGISKCHAQTMMYWLQCTPFRYLMYTDNFYITTSSEHRGWCNNHNVHRTMKHIMETRQTLEVTCMTSWIKIDFVLRYFWTLIQLYTQIMLNIIIVFNVNEEYSQNKVVIIWASGNTANSHIIILIFVRLT